METKQVIPNVNTEATGSADELSQAPSQGRGGSDPIAPGGPGGASGGQPETFEQRDPAGPATFIHGETILARVTGLAGKVFQKIRQKKLRQGEHWNVDKDLRVAYSEAGVVALLEVASGERVTEGKIAGVALTEVLQKTRLPEPGDGGAAKLEEIKGKVCRLFPNPYLVEIDLGNRKVLIRVKENKNLRRGMEVPLKAGKGPSGLELARRLPRFPGKW